MGGHTIRYRLLYWGHCRMTVYGWKQTSKCVLK